MVVLHEISPPWFRPFITITHLLQKAPAPVTIPWLRGATNPGYMSRTVLKFRMTGPAVYKSYMSGNFWLFQVPNLSVLNFRFFCSSICGLKIAIKQLPASFALQAARMNGRCRVSWSQNNWNGPTDVIRSLNSRALIGFGWLRSTRLPRHWQGHRGGTARRNRRRHVLLCCCTRRSGVIRGVD